MSITLTTHTVSKRIVIIGAGFGGIALAKSLRGKPFHVLLVDKHNYHTFQPLLYQVATGGLEADSIAYPVRRIFRGSENVRFQMAEVLDLDVVNQCVKTSLVDVPYDYLVIATGSTNNFFNFEPIKESLRALKSVPDAFVTPDGSSRYGSSSGTPLTDICPNVLQHSTRSPDNPITRFTR